jgi:hypothetical protein
MNGAVAFLKEILTEVSDAYRMHVCDVICDLCGLATIENLKGQQRDLGDVIIRGSRCTQIRSVSGVPPPPTFISTLYHLIFLFRLYLWTFRLAPWLYFDRSRKSVR